MAHSSAVPLRGAVGAQAAAAFVEEDVVSDDEWEGIEAAMRAAEQCSTRKGTSLIDTAAAPVVVHDVEDIAGPAPTRMARHRRWGLKVFINRVG